MEEDADDVDVEVPCCIQEKEEEFGENRLGRLRTCLWDLLEYPETSKVVAVLICLMRGLILLEITKVMLLLLCYVWKRRYNRMFAFAFLGFS